MISAEAGNLRVPALFNIEQNKNRRQTHRYMKWLNQILLVILAAALASCASGKKTPELAYHQWTVTYASTPTGTNSPPLNFDLEFNDEQGMMRVTVAGPEGIFHRNNINLRWHWARGDILDPTQKVLDTPQMIITGAGTNWIGAAVFDTKSHLLDDGWMEVVIGDNWYWLEVPSGIALCPGTPPQMAIPRSNSSLPMGVGTMTLKDHIMRWENLYCANLRTTKGVPIQYWKNGTFGR